MIQTNQWVVQEAPLYKWEALYTKWYYGNVLSKINDLGFMYIGHRSMFNYSSN